MFSGSFHPTRPRLNHDHTTDEFTQLNRIIVQLDPEKGPSLDALLEKYKQKLIKQSTNKGSPDFMFIPTRGFRCFDCRSYSTIMSGEMFQWHCLTK
jgi:hypothetical protein